MRNSRRATRRTWKRSLGSKNNLHNNYQDFQTFLEAGGRIGLQHDPLLYGAYLLIPFLVLGPLLVIANPPWSSARMMGFFHVSRRAVLYNGLVSISPETGLQWR